MEVPRHWRLQKQRYSLIGEICPHCETPMFPPRPICVACGDLVHPLEENKPQAYIVTENMTSKELSIGEHREVAVDSSRGTIFQSVSATG